MDEQTPWRGATIGSTRTEGSSPASDWASWERAGRAQPSSDPDEDLVQRLSEDVRMLVDAGIDRLRLTLEWAAIEPENGQVDQSALERYRTILRIAKDAGVDVLVCLHERSLPGWFAIDERGFRDERALRHLWPRHVDRCGEWFSDLVDVWVPIADPVDWATAAHLTGWAPPGDQHLRRFRESLIGAHRAGLEASRLLRGAGAVMTSYDLVDVNPDRDDPVAAAAARRVEETFWCWVDGFRDGEIHLPDLGTIPVEAHRDAFDIVGFRFAGSITVDADGVVSPHPSDEGLARTIDRVSTDGPDRQLVVIGGGRPLTVERGHGDDALATEIETIVDAQQSGLPIQGYLHDRAIDGYEWRTGREIGTGLIDRERRPKPGLDLVSAMWS